MSRIVLLLMSLGVAVALASGAVAQQREVGSDAPNIVFILTDDESLDIHSSMTQVKALIEDQGTVFENAFVTYPICCPSRATILRG